MQPPQKYILELIKKEKASELDCYSFYFKRPEGLDFLPGQYLRWMIEKDIPFDERGNSRFFTIASSPTEMDNLMLTTRIGQSTFKQTLAQFESGSTIVGSGPYGKFAIDENTPGPLVFLAGGIGITPFRSMAKYAFDKKLGTSMTLLVSFSTVEEVVFKEELENISKSLSTFTFVPTITKPEESKLPWNGEVGRISDEMIKKYVKDILGSTYYIVGPTKMVEAMEEIVKGLGVSADRMQIENFPGY